MLSMTATSSRRLAKADTKKQKNKIRKWSEGRAVAGKCMLVNQGLKKIKFEEDFVPIKIETDLDSTSEETIDARTDGDNNDNFTAEFTVTREEVSGSLSAEEPGQETPSGGSSSSSCSCSEDVQVLKNSVKLLTLKVEKQSKMIEKIKGSLRNAVISVMTCCQEDDDEEDAPNQSDGVRSAHDDGAGGSHDDGVGGAHDDGVGGGQEDVGGDSHKDQQFQTTNPTALQASSEDTVPNAEPNPFEMQTKGRIMGALQDEEAIRVEKFSTDHQIPTVSSNKSVIPFKQSLPNKGRVGQNNWENVEIDIDDEEQDNMDVDKDAADCMDSSSSSSVDPLSLQSKTEPNGQKLEGRTFDLESNSQLYDMILSMISMTGQKLGESKDSNEARHWELVLHTFHMVELSLRDKNE